MQFVEYRMAMFPVCDKSVQLLKNFKQELSPFGAF